MEGLLAPCTTSSLKDQVLSSGLSIHLDELPSLQLKSLMYSIFLLCFLPFTKCFKALEAYPHPSLLVTIFALPMSHDLDVRDRIFWQSCH